MKAEHPEFNVGDLQSAVGFKAATWIIVGVLGTTLLMLRYKTAVARGIYHFDEAYYLLETKTFRRAIEEAPQLLSGRLSLSDFKKEQMAQGTLFPPGKATPVYSCMLILFALLPIKFVNVGNLMSVFWTVPAGLALYGAARALGIGKIEAVLLALLYFSSPIVTYYSVSTFPHTMTAALLLLSIWAILRDRFICAGLCLGLTVTGHYGTLPAVLLCLVWALFEILASPDSRQVKSRNMIWTCMAFLAPATLLEAIYRIIQWRYSAYWKDITFRTYIQQFLHMVGENTPVGLNPENLHRNALIFLGFAHTQGIALTLVMLAAMGFLWFNVGSLKRRTKGLLLMNTVLLVFWVLNPGYIASRIVMFLLPGWFLILAAGIDQWERTDARRTLVMALFSVLIVTSTIRSWRIAKTLRSPYPDAVNYLNEIDYKGPVIDPPTILVWQYYLGRRVDFPKGFHNSVTAFRDYVHTLLKEPDSQGRIAIFIQSHWPYGESMGELVRRLSAGSPVRVWPLPYSSLDLYHYEDYYVGVPKNEELRMYWVTKNNLKELSLD